jgi:hypothetical protein
MKLASLLLLAALLFVPPCFAQVQPTTLPGPLTNISVTGSAVGFLGGASGGSQAAAMTGIWYQTTNRVSFGFETIQIPNFSSWYFGMGQYSLPLSSILGKKITSSLKFDASQVSIGFQGGLGKMNQSSAAASTAAATVPAVNRFAQTVGVSASIPMSAHLSFTAISAQWLHGGTQQGFIITPSTTAISTGFKLYLGSQQ